MSASQMASDKRSSRRGKIPPLVTHTLSTHGPRTTTVSASSSARLMVFMCGWYFGEPSWAPCISRSSLRVGVSGLSAGGALPSPWGNCCCCSCCSRVSAPACGSSGASWPVRSGSVSSRSCSVWVRASAAAASAAAAAAPMSPRCKRASESWTKAAALMAWAPTSQPDHELMPSNEAASIDALRGRSLQGPPPPPLRCTGNQG
mmetsp:Transcript_127657/g.408574  ORF Transcript_127657/g.408574 Transcript_127657/m.408574 type:complete len:203 (-) Transcript_127657:2073-2681(-)